ncbi:MAG: carboxypeptidase regulatory-like domain-containing protein [Myxococcales bacterium]|nr:carboxypeptidase regulatory-like domain-containing protein [Polyangiaceae bacterium]MDW8248658.1 carboxypeptidase regulatory-like domain-containing protein [Myxococcales bacterium]
MRATSLCPLPVLFFLSLAGVASTASAQQPPPTWPPGQPAQPPVGQPAEPPSAQPAQSPAGEQASSGWGFALDANASGPPSSVPPPNDQARRDAQLHEMLTLGGATGLLRVANATSAPVGTFRLQVLWDYFSTSSFLCKSGTPCPSQEDDEATHFGATFAASATVTNFLEGYVAIRSFANGNNQGKPELLQVLGDTILGTKVFLPTAPYRMVNIGADLQLLLLNGSGGVGINSSSTSVRGRAVSTFDFRKEEGGLPLLAHLNVGYRLDNSGKIVESIEEQRGRNRITRIERFGLGINRVDLAEIGIALEGVLAPGEKIRTIRPFVEYSIDIPVNRQEYACRQGRIFPGEDCLAKASNFGVTPSRLSLGVRVNPFLKGLMVTGAFDRGISGHRKFIEEVAPQAPWTLWWGVGYAFDTVEPPPVIKEAPPIERVVTLPPPPQSFVVGMVHEAGSQQGIPNAIVRFEGRDLTGLVTDNSGRFKTGHLEPGTYTFHVKAEGYREGTCSVTVVAAAPAALGATGPATPPPPPMPGDPAVTPAPTSASPTPTGSVTEVDCALEALPKLGSIGGTVVDAEGGSGVSGVTVTLTDSTGKERTSSTDGNGKFQFKDLNPGAYKLSTSSEAYMGGLGQADVRPREEVRVTISINKRPKNPKVTIGKREIIIKQQVHFETGSAKILSDSDVLLQEIADVLIRNPNLRRIEIQGHTDNQGTPAFNKTLSEQRAQAVRDRLISLGVKADRLEARGYGSERPLVPNVTAGNRARNRRVALIILEQDK